ncbi:MAG: response regulator, partial [Dolichospermum sp.]
MDRGYIAKTAGNGSDALLCVKLYSPELILLDVSMPQMNGYEVCRILKSSIETEDIPIIFISANENIQDKLEAFASGGADYITKPPQLAEVFARVHLHLSLRHLQLHLAQKNHELSQIVFERVGMLKELQRTNLLLHAQKEASIDGIFAVDEQGRIASFNRRFCEMWDIPYEVLVGENNSEDTNHNSPLGTFLIKSYLPDVLVNLLETTYDDPDVIRRGEIIYGERIFDYYTSPVSSDQNRFFG